MTNLYLAQSDTTAGFLSYDKGLILKAKNNNIDKKILQESHSIALIKQQNTIPKILNKALRRMKKTTFIFPNQRAFRVVRDCAHLDFLQYKGLMYSSSANLSNEHFCLDFAKERADIIILDKRGLFEAPASKIFQAKKKIRKIR